MNGVTVARQKKLLLDFWAEYVFYGKRVSERAGIGGTQ